VPLELDPPYDEPREPDHFEAVTRFFAQREADLKRREARNAEERRQLESERKTLEDTKANAVGHVASLRAILDGMVVLETPLPTALPHGELKRAVLMIVAGIQNGWKFSTLDFLRLMAAHAPHINLLNNRSNINTYLRECADEGVIDIEEEGRGQTPTTYRKK
jgi:hypothetical protein